MDDFCGHKLRVWTSNVPNEEHCSAVLTLQLLRLFQDDLIRHSPQNHQSCSVFFTHVNSSSLFVVSKIYTISAKSSSSIIQSRIFIKMYYFHARNSPRKILLHDWWCNRYICIVELSKRGHNRNNQSEGEKRITDTGSVKKKKKKNYFLKDELLYCGLFSEPRKKSRRWCTLMNSWKRGEKIKNPVRIAWVYDFLSISLSVQDIIPRIILISNFLCTILSRVDLKSMHQNGMLRNLFS